MSEAQWSVADAKAHLSQVIDTARREGPQTITRNGRPAAVVVSAEEWARKAQRADSLAQFLLASPLRDSGLDLERATDAPREGL